MTPLEQALTSLAQSTYWLSVLATVMVPVVVMLIVVWQTLLTHPTYVTNQNQETKHDIR